MGEGYRRLGAPGRTLAAVHSAWLGESHLLLVERSAFRERYRRVRFDEIQSLAIAERTPSYAYGLQIWGVLVVLGIVAILTSESTFGRVFFTLSSVPLLIGFAIHAFRGPTCRVRLRTAVEELPIGAWRRLRSTRLALEELSEIVRRAQGPSPDAAALLEPDAVAPIYRPTAERDGAPERGMRLGFYLATWWTLLAESVAATWQGFSEGSTADVVGLVTYSLMTVAAITAVVRHVGSNTPPALRRWGGAVVLFSIVEFVGLGVLSFIEMFDSMLAAEGPSTTLPLLTTRSSPAELAFAAIGFVLTLIGLRLLQRARSA